MIVFYDFESLFPNITLKEPIDYILEQIYVHNKLPIICSKITFWRLLEKLSTENSFELNSMLFKQADGCPISGLLSITLSDICMLQMENNIVILLKSIFHKKYIGNIINHIKKLEKDFYFKKLNVYLKLS